MGWIKRGQAVTQAANLPFHMIPQDQQRRDSNRGVRQCQGLREVHHLGGEQQILLTLECLMPFSPTPPCFSWPLPVDGNLPETLIFAGAQSHADDDVEAF